MTKELHCPISVQTESNQSEHKRVIGLARLLIYALTDAEELGSRQCAMNIRDAIADLKSSHGLADEDILPAIDNEIH